jgi:hypothetical protein
MNRAHDFFTPLKVNQSIRGVRTIQFVSLGVTQDHTGKAPPP